MPASLWDRMGGEAKIRPLCDDLYKMHATDPLTAPWFGGKPGSQPGKGCNKDGNIRTADEVRANVLGFFSAGIGGPLEYKGNDMKTAHMHMRIPQHVFHALTNHVMVGMEKHKTGGLEELNEVHAILMSLKPDIMYGTDQAGGIPKEPATNKSLWERMGGEAKIRPLCNDLYAMHSTDPLTAPWFGGCPGSAPGKGCNKDGNSRTADEVKENVFTFFSAGIGGPHEYKGQDMKTAHMHMDISAPAFHALTNHVMVGMEKHKTGGSGEREEVYAILMSLKPDVMAGTESRKPKRRDCTSCFAWCQ